MTIEDTERAAYISGDIERAALLARIADLEHTVARYECALEAIIEGVNTHSMTLKQCAGAAREVLP